MAKSGEKFRYERILMLASRTARKHLRSDYLDEYDAKCLVRTNASLGIDLYFLGWPDIRAILNQLTLEEKVHLGYYPRYLTRLRRLCGDACYVG